MLINHCSWYSMSLLLLCFFRFLFVCCFAFTCAFCFSFLPCFFGFAVFCHINSWGLVAVGHPSSGLPNASWTAGIFFARCHSAAEIPGSIHRIMQAIIARLQAGCAVGQVMGLRVACFGNREVFWAQISGIVLEVYEYELQSGVKVVQRWAKPEVHGLSALGCRAAGGWACGRWAWWQTMGCEVFLAF